MRNRIWNELCQAKFKAVYTSLLYEHHKKINQIYNISIIIISASGILGWGFWDKIPLIACIIIGIISIFKELKNEILLNDKGFEAINKMHIFYTNYLNEIENLWYYFENGLSEEEGRLLFYKIKKSEADVLNIVNEITKSTHKSIQKKASIECNLYFKNIFNTSSL